VSATDRANRIELQAADRPIREVNDEIRAALADGREVLVRDARSRHNLGVGLPSASRVRFEGSVGYYCGGLNDGAMIEIERNAGWGVGEAMARGEIVVGGYAGMAAGASMRGGLLHIRGDAGPRCGVAMKGGDIIVEVDGVATDTIGDLFNALEDNKPGERVEVVYQRGARRRATTVVLSRRARHVQEYFS